MQYHGWPVADARMIIALKKKILADIGKILVKNEDYTMQFGTALQEAHNWTYYVLEVSEESYNRTETDELRIKKKLEDEGFELFSVVGSEHYGEYGLEAYTSYVAWPIGLDEHTKRLLTAEFWTPPAAKQSTPPNPTTTPALECWQREEWQREEEHCYVLHFGFETDSHMYTEWPVADARMIIALKKKILADIGKILVKNEDYTMQFEHVLQEAHGWTFYAKEVTEDELYDDKGIIHRIKNKLEDKGYDLKCAGSGDEGSWETYSSFIPIPKDLDEHIKYLLTWDTSILLPTSWESKSVKTKPIKQKPTKQKPTKQKPVKTKPPGEYQKPFVGLSTGLFSEYEKATEIDTFLTDKFKQHIPSWVFKWDNAVQRYGVCRYKGRLISVSLPRARVNTVERTKRTILHEIAHALTPGENHNEVWKQKAREIGIVNPTTCCTKDDAVCMDSMKWALRNRETGEVYNHYTRKPTAKNWSTLYIRNKKKETMGKLEIVKLG